MLPGMDKHSGDSRQISNVFQAFRSEIEPNQNQLWSNLSELAILILPTSLAVNNQAWNEKGLSPMELLRFLFMLQTEFSRLQCPSQMPYVYEGTSTLCCIAQGGEIQSHLQTHHLCDYYASHSNQNSLLSFWPRTNSMIHAPCLQI